MEKNITLALANRVGSILKQRGLTISSMESCTAGGVINELVKISGASNYVKGGMITYTNEVKINVGCVSSKIIEEYTELSSECVEEMSRKSSEIFQTDIGIGVSGLLENGEEEGYAYIGIFYKAKADTNRYTFKGNRIENMEECIARTLIFLENILKREEK